MQPVFTCDGTLVLDALPFFCDTLTQPFFADVSAAYDSVSNGESPPF